jgi:hypothetical protein
VVTIAAVALLLAWTASGIRFIDADRFGVLDGLLMLGGARLVDGSWAVAPPGLLRLSTYPSHGIELPLPGADEAMLRSPDGSRFGFRGWITLRVDLESWRPLHAGCFLSGPSCLRSVSILAF